MKQRKIGWCATQFERFTYVLFFVGQLIFNTLVGSFIDLSAEFGCQRGVSGKHTARAEDMGCG